MTKIYLLIPFDKKEELKKSEKITWDKERKLWYCSELTEGLKPYEKIIVDIKFEFKDLWKQHLKSMKWIPDEKSWSISSEDTKIYTTK